ncbi:MAG: PT domain-containing protein [Clostridiales bacterium]|nr:PT domain-containing protein [Clostridiales bacterium]
MRMRRRQKKKAIVTIGLIAGIVIVTVVLLFVLPKNKIKDTVIEVVAYYNIDVNPSIEISVDQNNNVVDIYGKNDDGEQICNELEYAGKPIAQAMREVFDIMVAQGYIKVGDKNAVAISFYSDSAEMSEDELTALVPEEYRDICAISTTIGTITERHLLQNPTATATQQMLTQSTTPTVTISPEVTDEATPAPSESYEGENDDPKNDYSDLDRSKPFILKVKLSGNNAIFTWSEYDYIGYMKTELCYVPKLKTSVEVPSRTLKTIYDANIRTCTISLSSLSFKEAGDEYFFMLNVYEDMNDPDGDIGYLVPNTVSLQMQKDGSIKVFNDNPNIFGHGVIGEDYFAPTMTINEENSNLVIRWQNQTHDDYRGVAFHISKSSDVPSSPGANKTNYLYMGTQTTSYIVCPEDFYSLKAGETYYFTIFSYFHSGQDIVGNTIRATIPHRVASTIQGSLDFDTNYFNLSWNKLAHPKIDNNEIKITYTDEGSSDRKSFDTFRVTHDISKYNGMFNWIFENVPGRTYFIKISTVYNDGDFIGGNEIALKIPSATPSPTPEPTPEPSEEPTDDPTEEPTDEPTDDPTEEPTDDPTDEPTDDPTEEPTDDPTDEPTDDPTDEPTDDPTDEP